MSAVPWFSKCPQALWVHWSSSQGKREAKNGMQVLWFCLKILPFIRKDKALSFFQGEEEIGNAYQLGSKEV